MIWAVLLLWWAFGAAAITYLVSRDNDICGQDIVPISVAAWIWPFALIIAGLIAIQDQVLIKRRNGVRDE